MKKIIVTKWDDNAVFATVPLDKTKPSGVYVSIDQNARLIASDTNPDFLSRSLNGFEAEWVNQFLEDNREDFKQLYHLVEEQFNLVNK